MQRQTMVCVRVAEIAALVAMAQITRAQEVENIEPVPLSNKPTAMWTIDGGAQHRFDTDVDSGGEFNVSSFKTGIGMQKPWTDRLGLDVSASYARDAYDFETSETLGGKPWEDINSFRTRAILRYQQDPQWIFMGGGFLFSSQEEDAKEDSMEGGAMAGVIHIYNPSLIVGLGLIAFTQLEDDTLVVPFPLVRWAFAENWAFETGASDLGASSGPGMHLTWQCAAQWTYKAGAQLQRRRFRLDDDGVVPDGVGEDISVPLYVQAAWQINDATVVELIAGIHTAGELTLEDDSGDEIASEDYDPAGTIGIRAAMVF